MPMKNAIKYLIIAALFVLLGISFVFSSGSTYNWVRPMTNIEYINTTASWNDVSIFWAERATPVTNGAWAWGNGQTPRGSVVGYDNTHIVKIAAECGTVGTSLPVVVRKNGTNTSCYVTVTNTANVAYIANCDEYFGETDIIGIYSGTVSGSYSVCVGTVFVEMNKNISVTGLKGDKGDAGANGTTVSLIGYIKNFTNASLSGINLTGDIKPVNNKTQNLGNASRLFDIIYFQRFWDSLTPVNNKTAEIGNSSRKIRVINTMNIQMGDDNSVLYYPNITWNNISKFNIQFYSYSNYQSVYPIQFTWWISLTENVSIQPSITNCQDGGEGDDITYFTTGKSGEYVTDKNGNASISCEASIYQNEIIYFHVANNGANGRVYNLNVVIAPTPEEVP